MTRLTGVYHHLGPATIAVISIYLRLIYRFPLRSWITFIQFKNSHLTLTQLHCNYKIRKKILTCFPWHKLQTSNSQRATSVRRELYSLWQGIMSAEVAACGLQRRVTFVCTPMYKAKDIAPAGRYSIFVKVNTSPYACQDLFEPSLINRGPFTCAFLWN